MSPSHSRALELLRRPVVVLAISACVVEASSIALPEVRGYGTILFQVVAFGAAYIVASVTSLDFVDSHHDLLWHMAQVLNLILFLVPAMAVGLASKRWPVLCSIAIMSVCSFYLASLFWFFPATDGP